MIYYQILCIYVLCILCKRYFKKLCRDKKTTYQNNCISELVSSINKPKDFWSSLKRHSSRMNVSKPIKPSLSNLFNYFSNLLYDSGTNVSDFNPELFLSDPTRVEGDESIFNDEISLNEISESISNLKTNKSPGIDGLPTEFLKYSSHIIKEPLYFIFNHIFLSGSFPSDWTKGILIPLHKSGSTRDVNNYRGIILLSYLSKVFVSILNNRLKLWIELSNKVCEEQAGFRAGYNTVDNIFILHSVYIQKALSKKRHCCYCLFVDFSKAFDSLNRNSLFRRLIDLGVKGRLFNSILAMYTHFDICVSNGSNMSEFFNCNKGVRQGCGLSPTLFILYIDILAEMIKENNDGIQLMPHDDTVSILLYADDVVLISESIRGLQRHINTL